MADSGSQTPQRKRRWWVRAAVVAGGVLAGSLTAWALAAGGAQAAPVDDEPLSKAQQAGEHFRAEVHKAAKKLSQLPRKAAESVHEAVQRTAEEAEKVLRGAHRADEKQAEQQPERSEQPAVEQKDSERSAHAKLPSFGDLPALSDLPSLDDLPGLLAGVLHGGHHGKPQRPEMPSMPGCAERFRLWCEHFPQWFGHSEPDQLVPVPELPGEQELPLVPTAPAAVVPSVTTAAASEDEAVPTLTYVAEQEQRSTTQADSAERVGEGLVAHDESADQDFPGDDEDRTPLGAPGQPAATAPGNGSAQAGHADGSPMAITAPVAAIAASGVTQTLRRFIPGSNRPGGQPGVTPD